jgi:ligand-binding sensor domain-containing protein
VQSLRSLIIFLLCILSFRICAQQQNYVFQHLTTKDGLTSDAVRFIFQDSKGFYWFGYDDGFQKFDGKNFVTNSFGNEYIKSDILENNLVKPVEDIKGRIFVFNQGAVHVYNPNGKVDTIRIYDYADDGFSDIEDFCKDEWGNVWMVTQNNIYKYNNKNDHKCELWSPIGGGTVSGSIMHIIYDFHKKCIWLIRDSDILLVDLQSKKITSLFSRSTLVKPAYPKRPLLYPGWIAVKIYGSAPGMGFFINTIPLLIKKKCSMFLIMRKIKKKETKAYLFALWKMNKSAYG